MEPMILELSDHRGRVFGRTRIPEEGLLVGRGYANDVILDDPHVDPVHLRIAPAPDGVLQFEDVGSLNGTWLDGRGRISAGKIEAGMTLRIGRTTLRFVGIDQPVPPALPIGATTAPATAGAGWFIESPRIVAAIVVAAIGAPMIVRYFGSAEEETLSQLAAPGLTSVMFAALWAAGWAFTNRIVAGRFRFLAHMAWAAAIGLGYAILTAGFEWVSFFLPGSEWETAEGVLGMGLAVLLLAGHFRLLTDWPVRRRWGISLAVTLTLGTVIAVLGNGADGTSALFAPSALKPIRASLIPTRSVDHFFEAAESLKDTTAAEAE